MLVSGRDRNLATRKRAFLVTAYDWCGRTKKNLIFFGFSLFVRPKRSEHRSARPHAPEPNPNQAHLVNPTITLTRCTGGVRSWDPPTLPPELRSRLARGVRSWDPSTLPPELRSRLARTTRGVDHCISWAATEQNQNNTESKQSKSRGNPGKWKTLVRPGGLF